MSRYVYLSVLSIILFFAQGCATTTASRTYLVRVEKGDTLASIAAKYDTTWEKVAKKNELVPFAPLVVGSVLRIEPGPGGVIAGAEAGQKRISRKAPAPSGEAASPDEFNEEDFPAQGGEGDKKRRGLFFGNENDGASLHWPVRGQLSSLFGRRGRKAHEGVDVRAPKGTEVRAAGSGIVEFAGHKRGYGLLIIINHGDRKTAYAHLSALSVRKGREVSRDEPIGKVGRSGNATGYHLHFEIRDANDKAFDPLSVLKRETLVSQVSE